MRVALIVDEIMQVNDVFHVSVCEPDTLFLRVSGCSWDIVVKDIADPLLCIRRLLVYDYLDLTDHYSTFITFPNDDGDDDGDTEIELERTPEQEFLER